MGLNLNTWNRVLGYLVKLPWNWKKTPSLLARSLLFLLHFWALEEQWDPFQTDLQIKVDLLFLQIRMASVDHEKRTFAARFYLDGWG